MSTDVTKLADRWGLNPAHFWMWDRRPDRPVKADENGVVHVYGYQEVVEVYSSPAAYSSNVSAAFLGDAEAADTLNEGTLLQQDPPEHTKLRKLVSGVFTARMVAGLEPRITAITTELLDAAADGDGSELELVDALTYPMPVIVIAELLGVPQSDRVLFKKWVDQMVAAAGAMNAGEGDQQLEDADVAAAMRHVPELLDYLRHHVDERRAKPRQDLITKLVQAEVDGERLSDAAVVNFANELLVIGHATTSALLGNMLLCLDSQPEHMARLRRNPELVQGVTEETLRFLSPITGSYRVATTDTELAGVQVPKGSLVTLWLGAANRDERQFDRPYVFDPDRVPNPHIGFGRGIKFCIGAPLARLEARIAVNLLLERFPELHTHPDVPPEFLPVDNTIGVTRLLLCTG
ncbi:cytochrome P450 [Streptomyces milbemycinicus]|uniref:cytochrome P450 n=1 Tax=Streptomyces milbemycinicus TaxID=476552 RepID=UPI0033C29F66